MDDLIQIESLEVAFPVRSGFFSRIKQYNTVLRNISINLPRGKTVGLVGESGSGKTTLGRSILGLIPVRSGTITYNRNGNLIPLHQISKSEFRLLRKELQIVFQDPYSSLNPKMKIRDLLTEPLKYHFPALSRSERIQKCEETLSLTGLSSGALDRYPHEFSGGQRQRISIARAVILKPEFIVLDECVSALDVSIQAQIINLLLKLQEELNLTYLFISHDISVVRHLSHSIAVIHNGEIVENGESVNLTKSPEHEYTKRLIASVPEIEFS